MYEMANIYGLKYQVVNFEQDLVYDWVQHISYHQLGMSRNAGVYPHEFGHQFIWRSMEAMKGSVVGWP